MTEFVALRVESKQVSGRVMVVDGRIRPEIPALTFMTGWTRKRFLEYARKQHWQVEVSQLPRPEGRGL